MHSQIEPQIARLQTGRRPKNGSQLVRNRRVTYRKPHHPIIPQRSPLSRAMSRSDTADSNRLDAGVRIL